MPSASDNLIDIVCIKLAFSNYEGIHICSLYSPPRRSGSFTADNLWTNLLCFLASLGKVVVCGDFNGHSSLWSDHPHLLSNLEGRKIESALENSQLTCMNNGEDTWRSYDLSQSSALDLSLASPAIMSGSSWRVLDSTYGSDHFPIFIQLRDFSPDPIPHRPAYALGKVDWESFRSNCTLLLNELFTEDHSSVFNYNKFITTIHQAIIAAGGKKSCSKKFYSKPPAIWWTEECANLVAERRDAFKRFKKSPSLENLTLHQNISKRVKFKLRQIKQDKFKEFCSSLNAHSEVSNIWSTINAFRRKSSVAQRTNANSTRSHEAVVAAFDRAVPPFPPSCSVASPDSHPTPLPAPSALAPAPVPASASALCSIGIASSIALSASAAVDPEACSSNLLNFSNLVPSNFSGVSFRDSEMLLRPFTKIELDSAISSLKPKAASGPDLISNKMLINLPECGKVHLFRIYNHLFNFGHFPLEWKKFYMCFIPK